MFHSCLMIKMFNVPDHWKNWMTNNLLKLNEDKTEMPLAGPQAKRNPLSRKLGHLAPETQSEGTCLGIILDSELNCTSHVEKGDQNSFLSLKKYCQIMAIPIP